MHRNNEKISVIIPCYNVEKYIQNCLDSVFLQDYKNIEIIIIDDGSTDATLSIITKNQEVDERIILITQSNLGVSYARNAGLDRLSGAFLCFIDADDYVRSDYISKMLDNMYHNNSDIVCCEFYIFINHKKKLIKSNLFSIGKQSSYDSELINDFLMTKIRGQVWGKLYKSRIIKEAQLRFQNNISYGEDSMFVFKYLLQVKKASYCQDYLYYYTLNPHSITKSLNTFKILEPNRNVMQILNMIDYLYPNKFAREISYYYTRSFIGVLKYSFICTDSLIRIELVKYLKRNKTQTSYALLGIFDRLILLFYRLSYSVARVFFLTIKYFRNYKN